MAKSTLRQPLATQRMTTASKKAAKPALKTKIALQTAGLLPSLNDLRKERYRRSFYDFVRDFWKMVEPAVKFKEALHLRALCAHFEAAYAGKIPFLNVEIGPGTAKSMVLSVLGPAWVWGPAGDPGYRFICSTHKHPLTVRDSRRFRKLVYCREYQDLWGAEVAPMHDNNKQDYVENTARGFRLSTSVKSGVTGERAHMVITDDTLDATEAESDAALAAVREHLAALSTRILDEDRFSWINVGQRLNESDAGGWCREQLFETLCLPMEYDPSRRCTTSIGFSDWRTDRGELLFPALIGHVRIAGLKLKLGPTKYSAQYQQLPVPSDGGVLKRPWFQLIDPKTFKYGFCFQSIDTAFTTNVKNDTSAITTWGVGETGILLLDAWSGRLEMPELLTAVEDAAHKWKPALVLIEAKVNGISMIQTLERNPHFPYRIEGVQVATSKNDRAHAAAPFVARGKVFLPAGDPVSDAMSEALLVQAEIFPGGKVRDLADCAVQAFLHADATYTFEQFFPAEMLDYQGGKRASQTSGSLYAVSPYDDD